MHYISLLVPVLYCAGAIILCAKFRNLYSIAFLIGNVFLTVSVFTPVLFPHLFSLENAESILIRVKMIGYISQMGSLFAAIAFIGLVLKLSRSTPK